jgi:thioredoxin 1
MKKLLYLVPLLMMVFVVAGARKPKTDVGILFFEKNWQDILKKARAQHKPIFLDISASWCGPCKMLKKQTFTDKTVAKFYNANFINAAFDGEVGDGVMLANKFQIQGYPALFILDADGKILGSTLGFQSPDQLLKFGKQAIKSK